MKDYLLGTRFFMSETSYERLPAANAEVTFIGRSNVGKSSLICALCHDQALARVSKTPGRTRGINIFQTKRWGTWLVDLPGYGYATGNERQTNYWPEMISSYITGRPNLKMVYVLVDAERGVGPLDLEMLRWLRDTNVHACLVVTKVDKLPPTKQRQARAETAAKLGMEYDDIHWVSSKKDYGMNVLRQDVAKALGFGV